MLKRFAQYRCCRRTMGRFDALFYVCFNLWWGAYPVTKYRRRFALLNARWWLPTIERHNLATGPYGGWHCWWGPFHIWDTISHNRARANGGGWR